MTWKLADAKNKFSKVVDMALEEGPQRVTRRNDTVIVVALDDFERLSGKKQNFKDYLRLIPSIKGVNLDRDRSPVRKVNL